MLVDSSRYEKAISEVEITKSLMEELWICGGKNSKSLWKVQKIGDIYTCECPDFRKRTKICKHIIAVMLDQKEEVEVEESKKESYSGNINMFGYNKFEVISSFHKELRRGDFEQASYWIEVLIQGKASGAYLSGYIASIIGEELCLCDTTIALKIKSYLNYKKMCTYSLIAAVHLFCESKKWWFCEQCATRRLIQRRNVKEIMSDKKREIPNYAHDIHTRLGKMLWEKGSADKRWSGTWEGMFWRRKCVEQGKDLLTTEWGDVVYDNYEYFRHKLSRRDDENTKKDETDLGW